MKTTLRILLKLPRPAAQLIEALKLLLNILISYKWFLPIHAELMMIHAANCELEVACRELKKSTAGAVHVKNMKEKKLRRLLFLLTFLLENILNDNPGEKDEIIKCFPPFLVVSKNL